MHEPSHEAEQVKQDNPPTRRDWLFKVGMGVNVAAGVLLAIPLVGFVFSSFVERKDPRSWISLGPLDGFPEGKTRIATYRNPYTRPWDGQTANIPCWVRHVQGNQFQVFAINCTHLGCPVRWFEESGLVHVPLPRRNLLRRWRPRLGAAAAWIVSVHLQGRERRSLD